MHPTSRFPARAKTLDAEKDSLFHLTRQSLLSELGAMDVSTEARYPLGRSSPGNGGGFPEVSTTYEDKQSRPDPQGRRALAKAVTSLGPQPPKHVQGARGANVILPGGLLSRNGFRSYPGGGPIAPIMAEAPYRQGHLCFGYRAYPNKALIASAWSKPREVEFSTTNTAYHSRRYRLSDLRLFGSNFFTCRIAKRLRCAGASFLLPR